VKKVSARHRSRIRGCLMGVAIGDAIGMPWETCSHEEILDLTDGKGVTGLQDIPENKSRKSKDSRGIRLGETTDDWQLTRAVAESLIRRRGTFDLFDQAAAHVAAFETSTRGWGRSTRDGIAEIKRWFDTRGEQGRHPLDPRKISEGQGSGNGVLMKMAPLVCAAKPEVYGQNRESWIKALGGMTHGTDGIAAAILVAHLLAKILVANANVVGCLGWMRQDIADDGFKQSIIPASFAWKTFFEVPTTADGVRQFSGVTFLAESTTVFAVGTLARHPTDFRAAILESVNAGGDTDTQAAVVGALVGASVGLEGIPPEWIEAIPDAQVALKIADMLIEATSSDHL